LTTPLNGLLMAMASGGSACRVKRIYASPSSGVGAMRVRRRAQ
jgi:hypothetical protein